MNTHRQKIICWLLWKLEITVLRKLLSAGQERTRDCERVKVEVAADQSLNNYNLKHALPNFNTLKLKQIMEVECPEV